MGVHTRKRHKKIREIVISRDGLICCYCDKPLTLQTATVDHIVPDSRKGTFNSTNLTVSCIECNNRRGNQPFFDFCKRYNFSESKIIKYKNLYFSNLKIKVLNIAKEECLIEDYAIPISLIGQACHILKINIIDFSDYQNHNLVQIELERVYNRKIIKFNFEKIIKIIEQATY